MSNNSIEVKRKREQNMVNQMIKLYCKNHLWRQRPSVITAAFTAIHQKCEKRYEM